jgi:hypothetical protein
MWPGVKFCDSRVQVRQGAWSTFWLEQYLVFVLVVKIAKTWRQQSARSFTRLLAKRILAFLMEIVKRMCNTKYKWLKNCFGHMKHSSTTFTNNTEIATS